MSRYWALGKFGEHERGLRVAPRVTLLASFVISKLPKCQVLNIPHRRSLRKHPSLLALRRFGTFRAEEPWTLNLERGRHQYTFHSTGKTHYIKSHITCETFNVIYLIQCRLCNLQYIGETKRRLKDRFNEHRRPLLNPILVITSILQFQNTF